MPDVFRFIQGRPPDLFAETNTIDPEVKSDLVDDLSEVKRAENPATGARDIIDARIESGYLIKGAHELQFATEYARFFEEVDVNDDTLTFKDVKKCIEAIFKDSPEELSTNEKITSDNRKLYEFLIALKLSPTLQENLDFNPARYLKLTHYITNNGDVSADEANEYFQDTFILLPKSVFPMPSLLRELLAEENASEFDPRVEKELEELDELVKTADGLEAALSELSFLSPEDTRVVEEDDHESPKKARTGFRFPWTKHSKLEQPKTLRYGGQLLLSGEKVKRLSAQTKDVLESFGLDPITAPLPQMSRAIGTEIDNNAKRISDLAVKYDATVRITSKSNYSRYDHYRHQRYPGKNPDLKLTRLKGCGLGDLLVVKEQIKCYEAGEIAHIENILKGEAKRREHRRLKRTEETFILETEQSTTEEREHESTERFELQKTSSKVIERDQEFKAGVNVKAKYGPFVEVEANADFSQSSNVQTSKSSASKYSKDVTDRSASIITSRVREEQIRKVIIETEETNSHELNNIGGDKHTVGIYQWVDKISEAQVYRYGLRTLCDFMVPEPAAFYVHSQVNKPLSTEIPTPPPLFTITPTSVTRSMYRTLAARYKAEGVESPPEQFKAVSQAIEMKSEDYTSLSKTGELLAPAGYKIANVRAHGAVIFVDGEDFEALFGVAGTQRGGLGIHSVSTDANGEVAFFMIARDVKQIVGIAHGECEVTTQEFQKWQLDTFDTLLQSHTALVEQHEEALAGSEVAEGIQIQGRNPGKNRKLEENELKKSCLSVFTGQNFDGINAIQFSPEGYPEVNVGINEVIGPVVRFFEQAFEWEQMMYLFYPYFWGRKPEWVKMINFEDVDPKFEEFLQAGYARVVVPVRPGFEVPLQHFLDTGQVWNGEPLPEVGTDLYVSIIQEIKERQGAPLEEELFGDSWDVRLPTSLTRLRNTSQLPKWEKDGEGDWQPVPEEDGEISGPSPAPIVEP